jgi:signal transduction histidine kinase
MLSRLTKIIKALLLISKIENDQFLKGDIVSINGLINETLEDMEERLTEKNISLIIQLNEDLQFTDCNRSLLYTLFVNLLNNAIKYNKPNGSITIHSYKHFGHYCVSITDTGIGIQEDQVVQIFDRFKKLEGGDQESYGLGLPIVKTIARFHNIEVQVQSEVGVGSIFTLIF